jgi:hypothetical protein
MSTALDPLSDLSLSSAPADSTPPTDAPEAAPSTPKKVKKPRSPALVYSAWGLGVLLASIGLWFLLRPSTGTGQRPRIDQQPPLASELGPERDFEWSEEQLASKAGWKKSLAWMNKANVTLTPVKQISRIDPWRDERWEVEYRTGHTIESYTRELDALGIEPGLIDQSGEITYVSDLTNATPKTRTGQLANEKRYYMFWRVGSLKGADAKIFETAKLPTAKKLAAHFFPEALTQEMVARELSFAGGRPLSDVRRTVFAVKPTSSSFTLAVIRQEYQDGTVQEAAADPTSGKTKLKDKAAIRAGTDEPSSPDEGAENK